MHEYSKVILDIEQSLKQEQELTRKTQEVAWTKRRLEKSCEVMYAQKKKDSTMTPI